MSAWNAQASELTLYISEPVRNAALNAAVPEGALPWSDAYKQSYTIETFNGETLGTKTSGNWAIGTYQVGAGGNTNVAAANVYGGAGTGTVMGSGGSNFLNAGTTGTPVGVTVTLTNPARYVGFWWSAGSNGNNVELLDENDNVLTAMTTDDLMAFLNSPSNLTMKALDQNITYSRAQYNGNPFIEGNNAEPYVYLNYVLKDTTAFGSTTIKKIRFWGAGFELDNIAVREEKLPGLPAETELPQTWVPTKITNTFEDPPATVNDSGTTRINTPSGSLDLTDNDPHVLEGSSVTAQTTSANGGTIAADPANPGKFIYTPAIGFVGVDTFSYDVCLPAPNQTKCATAEVTMTVTAPDLAIDLSGLPATATVGVPYQGQLRCSNLGDADALSATACTTGPLPDGLSIQACTVSPDSAAWTAGNLIAQGAVVTCEVGGTPANVKKTTTTTGTTGTTGDRDLSNNTATQDITVVGAADVVVDLSGLPSTGTVGTPYQGSYSCSNRGSADQAGANCAVSGLPAGITQGPGACTIVTPAAPAATGWTSPSTIPEGAVVTCVVEGKPTEVGSSAVSASGVDSKLSHEITIRAVPVPTAVPSLSTWALLVLATGLAMLGMGRARKHSA
ncbi:Ig-like domain-containing protein [Comamonas sp. 23]|uniref:Npun_F0296 family exosortase-dependent surface protein n=1 Tax=Comamonas sp. 23 TaxID=3415008 RepID=UPI003C70094E